MKSELFCFDANCKLSVPCQRTKVCVINYIIMSYNLDFTNEGFSNIVLQNEKNLVHVKTNAFDDEEAWRWKTVFTKHNNIAFNVDRLCNTARCVFHEKFMCLHGEKRHIIITNIRNLVTSQCSLVSNYMPL